ncbi:MAG TPA: transporter substrate-binding domain-containing protein [Gemmataceae bacterium]|nr:transporter substrate-binding domain-containing protein [Bauldia sp.]HZZ81524.1 transporter substrate-binding domain-containing protein [Gemmataceae bacterium]
MSIFRSIVTALFAFTLSAAAGAAHADPLTVDNIISRGTINVGIILDTPPYGVLDAQQNPDGFDTDVAKLLAQYLGVKLNVVSLVGANRIPFLLTNKVDLVMAGLAITPERAKQVAFSSPISADNNMVYGRTDQTIKSIDDLIGKRAGTTRGSAGDTIMTKVLGDKAQIMRFDNNSSQIQALLGKQVDTIAVSEIYADSALAQSPDPTIEKKFVLNTQVEGIAMRKEDTDLLQWVNSFVLYIKSDGELNAIYQKWWHKPVPDLPTF